MNTAHTRPWTQAGPRAKTTRVYSRIHDHAHDRAHVCVHGRVRAVYTDMYMPCTLYTTACAHTAVYRAVHVHSFNPSGLSVHPVHSDPVHKGRNGPSLRPFIPIIHGPVCHCVDGQVHGRGRLHGCLYTVVYTATYTAVYTGVYKGVYAGKHGPCS